MSAELDGGWPGLMERPAIRSWFYHHGNQCGSAAERPKLTDAAMKTPRLKPHRKGGVRVQRVVSQPSIAEIRMALAKEINMWCSSYRESDGRIHNQAAIQMIACLQAARRTASHE